MAKLAILGFGTVGSGIYEVIRTNGESIKRKAGEEIEIKYIVDIRDFNDHLEKHLFTKDFNQVLNDPEVNVVAEVIGGIHPAYDFTKAALLAGKSVISSNKELVATHGAELLAIAKERGVKYFFEASVGGGIPIIMPLHQSMSANEIQEIKGILNGTTNYILTQMIKENKSFETALADAQAKGYAEADPAADVEGHDACRKIAILSSLVFGKHIDYKDIPTEGITKLTLADAEAAKKLGYVIKLIGSSKRQDGKVAARVAPMLVPVGHPLSGVDDVFNAVLVDGNATGEVMFYGRGAGKLPTASAVVSDIIDAVRHNVDNILWGPYQEGSMAEPDVQQYNYYIRVKGVTPNQAEEVFGKPKLVLVPENDEIVLITEMMSENELKEKLTNIQQAAQVIRVLA